MKHLDTNFNVKNDNDNLINGAKQSMISRYNTLDTVVMFGQRSA